MISDTVWLGAIVAAGSVFTVVFNRWGTAKAKREQDSRDDVLSARTEAVAREAKKDSDRVREVAAQAALAAKLLLEHDEEQTALTRANAEAVALKLHELGQGQDRIHVLVNSNLQAAMEAHLAALKGWLASVVSTGGDATLIEELGRRVAELEASLADRAKATEVADAEVLPAAA
jgi:hypothetical protein